MKSFATETGCVQLPLITGEYPMIPFDVITLAGLPEKFKNIAKQMLSGIDVKKGMAYFTTHNSSYH